MRELLLEVVAHLDVLEQHAEKFLVFAYQRELQLRLTARRKPIGLIFCPMAPYFLPSPTVTKMWQVGFMMRAPRPLAGRGSASASAALHQMRVTLKLVDVGAVVVLGVGDGRLEHLADDHGALLGREG